jgi:hypothetical protein
MEDFRIITIVRQCAYDMQGTTSRSWLVKGQEVNIHVHNGRGFSCPSGCLVKIILIESKLPQLFYYLTMNKDSNLERGQILCLDD